MISKARICTRQPRSGPYPGECPSGIWSLNIEVLGPDPVGRLHYLLNAALALVEYGLATVPQDDSLLVDLQTPVKVYAAVLQFLHKLLEGLYALLKTHLADFLFV